MRYICILLFLINYTCNAGVLTEGKDSSGSDNVYYKNNNGGFYLYPEDKSDGISYSLEDGYISESKKYAIIYRSVKVVAEDANDSTDTSQINSCDIVDLSSGCIKYSIHSECDASWNGDKLSYHGNNLSSVAELENIDGVKISSPEKMLSKLIFISKSKNIDMMDEFFTSGSSYLACYPVNKKNEQIINDIGYYLSLGNKHKNAIDIYNNVLSLDSKRVVLMLNIADSYWALGEKEKAKEYYQKYIVLMNKAGKLKIIPERVKNRAI